MMKEFRQSIGGLKGVKVRFFYKEGRFIEGTLIEVKQDHLVVNVNEHIFYLSLNQICGISNNAKNSRASKSATPAFIDKNHFIDILDAMKYNIVTINALDNEAYVGLLVSLAEDCIMLVNNNEQYFIDYSYIFNVFDGIYENSETQDDDTQEQGTQVEDYTEQTIETPAITIQTGLEPIQEKIAESSFLDKNIIQAEDQLHVENQRYEKFSAAEENATRSEEKTPASSFELNIFGIEDDGYMLDRQLLEAREADLTNGEVKLSADVYNVNSELSVANHDQNEIIKHSFNMPNSMEVFSETKEAFPIEEFIIEGASNDLEHAMHMEDEGRISLNSTIDSTPITIEDSKESTQITEGTYEEVGTQQVKEPFNVEITRLPIPDMKENSMHNEQELGFLEKNEHTLMGDEPISINIERKSHGNISESTKVQKVLNRNKHFCFMELSPKEKLKRQFAKKRNTIRNYNVINSKEQGQEDVLLDKVSDLTIEEGSMVATINSCQNELIEIQSSVDKLNEESDALKIEESMLVEVQYLALMKHAEKMFLELDSSQDFLQNLSSEEKLIIKGQYLSLFKSAKKMYIQMKNERLEK